MLGTVARDHVLRIAEALATADTAVLLRAAQALEEFAPDYAQLLDELASLLVRIALRQAHREYAGDELYAPELLARLADSLTPEDVQLYYQTAITGKRDLPLAPDPRTGFEMTLLRMIAFRPAAQAPGARPPARAEPPAGTAAASGTEASGSAGVDPWPGIVSALELTGAARQLASHCVFLGRQGAAVRLGVDARNPPVRTPAQEEKLAQALSRYFGEPVRLEFQTVAAGAPTPALAARRVTEQELASARQAFENDPGVKGLRERFGATVLPESVRPVK
jgi:DNA polymerase-3 subunit gamma/tau